MIVFSPSNQSGMAVAANAGCYVVTEGDNQDIINVSHGNEDFDCQPVEKHLLILGETGVGKSYLINALFGEALDGKAKVSQSILACEHEPIVIHTAEVSCKVDEKNVCTKFIIYDSRGFADPSCSDTTLFKKFTKKIDIDKLDAVFVCHRMGSRFNNSSVRFAELLANHFLKENEVIWNKCILVLTQANLFGMLEDEDKDDTVDDENIDPAALKMLNAMKDWSLAFNEALVKQKVSQLIYQQIPVCLAGSKKSVNLLITDDWIKELLHVTLRKCYNKVKEVRAIQLKKRGSIGYSIVIGGAVGGAIGASVGVGVLSVLGLPVGLTIGALVGWKYGKKTAKKKEEEKIKKLIAAQ